MSKAGIKSKSLTDLGAHSAPQWTPASAYFAHAEPFMAGQWANIIFPFIEGCDFTDCLDLAAGHGRNSEFLLKYCKTLVITDYHADNVEVCRKRFQTRDNISYFTCNGFDLQPQPDASITLIYSFDAMVHFDSDVVRSYLRDFRRVLKPGGRAFLHHSNYTGGHEWTSNPSARNFMSKELFAHYAIKEDLKVIKQKTLNWQLPDHDCLSLVERAAT
jgi:SAM-dependent methyltransferase